MSVPRLARLRLRPEESLKVPHRSMRKPEGRQRPTGARASREKRARISQEKARTPGEEKKKKKKHTGEQCRGRGRSGPGKYGKTSTDALGQERGKKKSPRATPHKLRGKKNKTTCFHTSYGCTREAPGRGGRTNTKITTWPPPITHPLPQGDSGAPEEWRKKKKSRA